MLLLPFRISRRMNNRRLVGVVLAIVLCLSIFHLVTLDILNEVIFSKNEKIDDDFGTIPYSSKKKNYTATTTPATTARIAAIKDGGPHQNTINNINNNERIQNRTHSSSSSLLSEYDYPVSTESKDAVITNRHPNSSLPPNIRIRAVPKEVNNKNKSNSSNNKNNNHHSNDKNLTHFIFHIPKTGGEYALFTLTKIMNQEEWIQAPTLTKTTETTSIITDTSIGKRHYPPRQQRLPKSQRYRACNQATAPIANFYTNDYLNEFKGVKCTMWMSEVRYDTRPIYKYIILRNPKEHVISQYFHCRESNDHAKWKRWKTPKTLDMWLEKWLELQKNQTITTLTSSTVSEYKYDPTTHSNEEKAYKKKTYCYNPTNFQSFVTQFDVTRQSLDELEHRFTVLGDNAQMTKTICMILIRYTGSVPRTCNCTSNTAVNIVRNTSTGLSQQEQEQQQQRRRLRQQQPVTGGAGGKPSRRSGNGKSGGGGDNTNINLNYNASLHGHGVKHHGATYNTTRWQEEAIANLTTYDQVLYDWGRQIFARQVRQVEEEYQVRLCDAFRS